MLRPKLCLFYNIGEQQKLLSGECMDSCWEWESFGKDNRTSDENPNNQCHYQIGFLGMRLYQLISEVLPYTL